MTWFQSAKTDPKFFIFLYQDLGSEREIGGSLGKRKIEYTTSQLRFLDWVESMFMKITDLGKLRLVFNPYVGIWGD